MPVHSVRKVSEVSCENPTSGEQVQGGQNPRNDPVFVISSIVMFLRWHRLFWTFEQHLVNFFLLIANLVRL